MNISSEGSMADQRQGCALHVEGTRQHDMSSCCAGENQETAGAPQPAPVIAPPFTLESALKKVRLAEDAWNSRDPHRVSLAYSEDSEWRNRDQFITGRDQIRAFLTRKWARELDYRLVKALWAYTADHIAVRFQYEWRNEDGAWFRSYGNELWEFDARGLMARREASINDVAIRPADRRFHWAAPGPRPTDHEGIEPVA